jgi:quercetin dioxygenase-like cupin family protein
MDANDPLSFLGRALPGSFVLKVFTLPPGDAEPYREADWADAIVVVEQGELELECTRGGSRTFRRGAILWFAGLPLRTLRNRGEEPVVLTAVSRAAMSFPPPPGLSCGVDHEANGEHHD